MLGVHMYRYRYRYQYISTDGDASFKGARPRWHEAGKMWIDVKSLSLSVRLLEHHHHARKSKLVVCRYTPIEKV